MSSRPLLKATSSAATAMTFDDHNSKPSFATASHLSIYRNQPQCSIISPKLFSSKASNNNYVDYNEPPKIITIQKRNMLINLGALTTLAMVGTPISSAVVDFPKSLDSVLQITTARPQKSRSVKEKAEEEEAVVVAIQVSHADAKVAAFDVYINYVGDINSISMPQQMTQFIKKGYVGSFSSLRHNPRHRGKMDTSVRLGLNKIIDELGANDDESLEVTLVPTSGKNSIVIKDVRIEYIHN